MKRFLISAVALTAAASFGFGQAQQQQRNQLNQTGNAAANQQQQQQSQREEMGPEHAQKCIRDAASDNQFEIQAGQFIEQRSQDPQVKQFAQRLVQDHQQAQQQLQQVARTERVTITDQLDPIHQAIFNELQQKQGPALDRMFVFSQVGGHEIDVLKSRWQAQHEQNPQLKQYAQQQLPTLEEHLRLARQIAEQWVPEARQAGERMRGTDTGGIRNPTGGTTGGTTGSGTGAGGSQNPGRTNGR